MKNILLLIVLFFVFCMSGCASKEDKSEADSTWITLNQLYKSKKFDEVDVVLKNNKEFVEKYDFIAEYLLHRRLMQVQEYPSNQVNCPGIIPKALLDAKINNKTTYLSQSYQEYVLSLQGSPKFIDGFCPAEPLKDACHCRIRAINDGISLDYFSSQRDMWFSEYLYKMCPNDALKAIHVFSAAAISESKAIEILVEEKNDRNEAEFKKLEIFLCNYKNVYSDYEAPYKVMEKTDLVNCDLN